MAELVKNINWKVRAKNPAFWMAFIPSLLVFIQAVAFVFGWQLDFSQVQDRILAAIDALFVLLGIIGVVVDPTTAGLDDSKRAMGYTEPAE